jgi:hypothetical protein
MLTDTKRNDELKRCSPASWQEKVIVFNNYFAAGVKGFVDSDRYSSGSTFGIPSWPVMAGVMAMTAFYGGAYC